MLANLKTSTLESLELYQKFLKLCFLNMFSFFFITCLITSMISCINFNGKIMIFKPNIRFFGLITFLLRKIFSLGNFFFIFSAIDVSSRRSIGLGNLQRFITSRVSFLILKTPSLPLKNALYICFFFFCNVFCFFVSVFSDSL